MISSLFHCIIFLRLTFFLFFFLFFFNPEKIKKHQKVDISSDRIFACLLWNENDDIGTEAKKCAVEPFSFQNKGRGIKKIRKNTNGMGENIDHTCEICT